ncbi:hypothetical protein [Nocardia sp. NPDC006630]|uniref:hypothetical protein n=1 Tax=Nocardia sp. NPDC006630 TaxID=3157181 RepID=UPI0033B54102
MSESVGSVTATPNPTVLDVLRTSPVGALVDTPVSDVISGLGLPQLPQLPAISLPDLSGLQMPTLPTIDLSTLIQPVISLLSAFGTGASSMGTELISIFSSVAKALTSAVDTSKQATSAVSSSWQGDAANAAQNKSNAVEADAPKVVAQGDQLKMILLEAERVVAEGYAEISGVISGFISSVIAGGVFLFSPPGIPFLITLATNAITDAGVIAARTRGELTVNTAQVVSAGMKIPITGAPNVGDLANLANQVTQAVQPFLSVGSTAVEKVAEKGSEVVSSSSSALSSVGTAGQQLVSALTTSNTNTDTSTTANKTTTTTNTDKTTDGKPLDTTTVKTDDSTGGGGGGIPNGMPMGAGLGSNPLNPSSGAKLPTAEGLGSGSPISRAGAQTEPVQSRSTTSMPGMSSGAGLANKNGDEESSGERTALVTGAHGDEVVGVIEGVSIPVVGAVEAVDEPPDKALTL